MQVLLCRSCYAGHVYVNLKAQGHFVSKLQPMKWGQFSMGTWGCTGTQWVKGFGIVGTVLAPMYVFWKCTDSLRGCHQQHEIAKQLIWPRQRGSLLELFVWNSNEWYSCRFPIAPTIELTGMHVLTLAFLTTFCHLAHSFQWALPIFFGTRGPLGQLCCCRN